MNMTMKTMFAMIVMISMISLGTVAAATADGEPEDTFSANIKNLGELTTGLENYKNSNMANAEFTIKGNILIPSGIELELTADDGKTITFIRSSTLGSKNMFTVDGGTLTIGANVIIDGKNIAVSKSAILVINDGSLTMNGGEIYNNNVSAGYGGAVRVENGTFTMEGGKIYNNISKNGGSVTIAGNNTDATVSANFIMNGGEIYNNTATISGAGVYLFENNNSSATFTMSGGSIHDNKTAGDGGGVYVYGGSFTMKGGDISKNTATNGGGVRVTENIDGVKNPGSFIMEDGEINENTATRNGGGVSVGSASSVNSCTSFTMNGGKICNNIANGTAATSGDLGMGGGIHIFNRTGTESTITINNGEISGNKSNNNGCEDMQISMSQCSNPVYIGNGQENGLIISGTIMMYGPDDIDLVLDIELKNSVDIIGAITGETPYVVENASNGTYSGDATTSPETKEYKVLFNNTLGYGSITPVTFNTLPYTLGNYILSEDDSKLYEFLGWSAVANVNSNILTEITIDNIDTLNGIDTSNGVTLYPAFKYTVNFIKDDIEIQTGKYLYDVSISLPDGSFEEPGYIYEFTGWYNEKNSQTIAVDKTEIACNGPATYVATYNVTHIEYTVEFLDYNSNVLSSAKYYYDDVIQIPRDPTRSSTYDYSFRFAGWSPQVSTSCNGDATYTATYRATPISHVTYSTVTIEQPDNGTISGDIGKFADGTSITLTAKANEGYKLASWSNGEKTETISFKLTSDITLSATFEEIADINDEVPEPERNYTHWIVLLGVLIVICGMGIIYHVRHSNE